MATFVVSSLPFRILFVRRRAATDHLPTTFRQVQLPSDDPVYANAGMIGGEALTSLLKAATGTGSLPAHHCAAG